MFPIVTPRSPWLVPGGVTVRWLVVVCLALVAPVVAARAQPAPPPTQTPVKPELPRDALGRRTPRGTVFGFLNAARRGENDLARQDLKSYSADAEADELAQQLFVVLDARFPARLAELSDAPEGSHRNPLRPNDEVVGTIASVRGPVDIVVERVDRSDAGPVWLFSATTLDAVPALYRDVMEGPATGAIPRILFARRFVGMRLFDWLALLLGLPLLYFGTVLLNRVLTPPILQIWRRLFGGEDTIGRNLLPLPARLLILTLAARWLVATLPLSLLVRQVLLQASRLITIVSAAWLLILLNGALEAYIRRRIPRTNVAATLSLLRVVRRVADALVIFAAVMAVLWRFGVDPTPLLAGLGVGGIAVALAAQKTLENVIGGASLIFDQAVRVGDVLKVGDIQGTVDHIGLRSTRIRTLDRTIVSVPNGQIANMSLETISARDKFWFHPIVGLRYETTTAQLRTIIDGIRQSLAGEPRVDRESVRVRFLRLGAFSLDVEVFAYVFANDWSEFLEIQEQLLFMVTDVVEKAGTAIAFPSQTMYVTGATDALPVDQAVEKWSSTPSDRDRTRRS
jgi:MscS family membrane protein